MLCWSLPESSGGFLCHTPRTDQVKPACRLIPGRKQPARYLPFGVSKRPYRLAVTALPQRALLRLTPLKRCPRKAIPPNMKMMFLCYLHGSQCGDGESILSGSEFHGNSMEPFAGLQKRCSLRGSAGACSDPLEGAKGGRLSPSALGWVNLWLTSRLEVC